MKIEELRQRKAEKVQEVRKLNEENKIEDAEKLLEEVRGLDKQIKIAEELEADEMRDLQQQKINKEERGDVKKMEKVNEMRALTKAVLKKEMSEEERAVIKSSDNSAVLPDQYINKLEELRKGFGSLKQLCDVIPVTKNEGTMPIVDLEQNEMKDVLEGDDIANGDMVTTDMSFKCSKVGLLDVLPSELVEDAEIDIQNTVEKNFMEIAIRKENVRILNAINTGATPEVATDYTTLEDVMAKALPSVKAGLVTLANVEGYAHLKNMKDKQGRSLGLITDNGGVEYYNGKPIITFDSSLVTPGEGMSKVYYSLNMKEAIKFFDRKGITIARADKFENDTKLIRVLERFDVKTGTKRSIKKIELA